MRFLMMVKSNERTEAGILPTEQELADMGAFNERLIKANAMLAGDGLQASSKGSRVRIAGKKTTVIDGPFAEAKELLAGYWVIQVKSKAEAVEWAKQVPLQEGEVELREIYELEDFPVSPEEKPDGWREKEQAFRDAPAGPSRKAGTTRYLVALKADKLTETETSPGDAELFAKMGALMDEYVQKGAILAGDGLKPSKFGARIKYAGDKRTVVDGPFTESKELLAGYTVLQTATKEEAVEFGRRMLTIHVEGVGAEAGEVEVRQFFEIEDFPVSPDEKADGWRKLETNFRDGLAH